jgi:hypothetical protein
MSDLQYAHGFRFLIDHEEYAIHVRLSSTEEDANGLCRVDALRCDRPSLRMPIQSENGPLGPIEPRRTLVGRSFDDPEKELFEVRRASIGTVRFKRRRGPPAQLSRASRQRQLSVYGTRHIRHSSAILIW